MSRCLLLFVLCLLCLPAQAHARVYQSPNGRGKAVVTAQPVSEEGTVTISYHSLSRVRRRFVSDGNHGQIIERAAWTPDSCFFVFVTTSSGGHSPWHHWTFVWSRRDNKIHSLDDAYPQTGGTMTDAFRLTAPDRIHTLLWDNSDNGKPLAVRLSRVQWKPGIGDRR